MSGRNLLWRTFAGVVLAGSAGAPSAGAELIATADSNCGCPLSYTLKRVNATTGAALPLPPGVNQLGRQTHPSISPNRRHLVFLRTYQGSVRVVMVDRATGQSADLFNGFEAASDPPTTPTFSADGTKVLTGRRLERLAANAPPGTLQASYTETDVTTFPNGPFSHRVVPTAATDSTAAGRTIQLTPFSTARFAFEIDHGFSGPPARIAVQQSGATETLSHADEHLRNPTISATARVVVYEAGRYKLVFRPLNGLANAPATPLPPLVNAPNRFISAPEFSPDGRYLAFVRTAISPGERGRLFVWDTQTQVLLNPEGVPGITPHGSEGAIALEERRVFRPRVDVGSVLARFGVADDTYVDMLVQRVVGTTTVLGRPAPRLRVVGRVPLGRFADRRATRQARWNGVVGRRRLPPGDYLVTLRSLTRGGDVREHARPERLRIR